jgi:hypothetical protein
MPAMAWANWIQMGWFCSVFGGAFFGVGGAAAADRFGEGGEGIFQFVGLQKCDRATEISGRFLVQERGAVGGNRILIAGLFEETLHG